MTMAPALWQRKHLVPFAGGAESRLFQVDTDSQILAHCHWHNEDRHERATLIIVHGLEGSSHSNYVRGLAFKAFALGMNTVRLNLRNCGGTLHLTPTLYNAGMSADALSVLRELKAQGFRELFLCGYSLGGNIVLKAAGELGKHGADLLSGVAAISPSLDLDVCVEAIERRENRFYEQWFLRTLKGKIRRKARLYPDIYDVSKLKSVRQIRQFDDTYTAPIAGYGTAANYYYQASAVRVLSQIVVPTLIIASQDDPLVPFDTFLSSAMQNPLIKLIATEHGGHAGFIQHVVEEHPLFDHFWAENRVVDFVRHLATHEEIAGGI